MNIFLALITSYLVGAIPTAYLLGKIYKGIDIREHGSGNIGASNTFRVLGKIPGTGVLVFDILKGVLAITVVGDIFGFDEIIPRILLGLAVVSGHNWTIFLKFKGGKGIATSLGVLIGLTMNFPSLRPVLMMCVLCWICVFLISGYISLSSMIATILLPVAMALTNQSIEMVILGVIFCIFVVVRHRPNIKRLILGQESRVNFPFKRKINSPPSGGS